MVMSGHAFFVSMNGQAWSGAPRLISAVTRFGWLGVDLFFVLSGFLITGILLETKERPHYWRNFYARRALRILPLYFVILFLILIFYRDSAAFVLLSALFLANVTPLFGVAIVYGPLWSLAVEEHFYLLWPSIVKFATRRRLALIVASILIGEPIVRMIGFQLGVTDTYYYSWFRFDGLAWGALLALCYHREDCTARKLWRLAGLGLVGGVAIFLIGLPFGISTRHHVVGASLQFAAAQMIFAGVVAAALASSGTLLGKILNWRPLRRCGDLSYCLYLIHLILLDGFDALMIRLGWNLELAVGRFGHVLLRAAAALTVSYLMAELSFRYFETPILRLKRYF